MVRAMGGALGGGAIAFTLMACYGAPPCDEPECRSDDGDASTTADGGGRDVNRPDVIVTPSRDGGDASVTLEAGADDAGDGGDGG